jgi:diacylglycerol kinase (ATP)
VSKLVVVNPAAGKGGARRVWDRVRRALGTAGTKDWEAVLTERPGHARELARAAAIAGYERIVAVGGDGTICEVANGVAHTETAVGIIPAGTGNDCARNLGIPARPVAAARLALTGAPRAIDLGEVETDRGVTYFVNVAGFGFDAEVAWRVNAMPKLVGGSLPYVVGVVQTLRHFRSPTVQLTLGDRTMDDNRLLLAAVANGPSYGGGMRIAPDANPDDGLFDVCFVGDLSVWEILRLVPKMYSGGHRSHPAVKFFRGGEVRAQSNVRVRCQADGELVGDLPASFRIHAGGLRCITGPR